MSERDPVPGLDVVLSIDQHIQLVAQDALAGRRGAAVVIDPSNGEVLALVSAPSFDPNIFASTERRNRASVYLNDPMSPLLNRAVSAQFPPGSVFKIMVAMAGLEEKKFIPSMTVDCPGYYELGDRRFTFSHAYGVQDLFQAMAHSANEYFFHLGLLLGPEQMARYARVFGLGDKTGIDMPYEVKGHIPGNKLTRSWYKGDTVNMSIGQGDVLATPLQIVRMIATVHNEGWMPKLHIMKSLDGKNTEVSRSRVSFRKPVWDTIKRSLQGVVDIDTGTASELKMDGLVTYGKTGTAQAGAGKEDHAWFAGVTRSEGRTIAYCFLLEHGGSSKNAVMAVREMLVRLQGSNLL
jgi:penicillin-binding protein 2